MKTLNEVIHALEICDSAVDDCMHCAYFLMNCQNLRPLRADAVHYLKEYRKTFDSESTAAAPWNTERNRYCCDHCGGYVGKHDKFCPGCGRMLADWTEAGRKAK